MTWAAWIALAALIAAVGRFADDYYVKHDTRNRLRDLLTRGFLFIDAMPVPDLVNLILRWFRGRLLPLVIVIACAVYALAALIETATKLETLWHWSAMFAPYLRAIAPWNAALAGLGMAASMWCLGRAGWARPGRRRIGWLVAAAAAPGVIGLGSAFVFYKRAFEASGEGLNFVTAFMSLLVVWVGTMTALVPVALVVAVVSVLAYIRFGLRVIQWSLLRVFDVSSSPRNSPLTYFCALLSVAILAVRVVVEVTRGV